MASHVPQVWRKEWKSKNSPRLFRYAKKPSREQLFSRKLYSFPVSPVYAVQFSVNIPLDTHDA
jgi:hypothetical protein